MQYQYTICTQKQYTNSDKDGATEEATTLVGAGSRLSSLWIYIFICVCVSLDFFFCLCRFCYTGQWRVTGIMGRRANVRGSDSNSASGPPTDIFHNTNQTAVLG